MRTAQDPYITATKSDNMNNMGGGIAELVYHLKEVNSETVNALWHLISIPDTRDIRTQLELAKGYRLTQKVAQSLLLSTVIAAMQPISPNHIMLGLKLE